VLYCVLSGGVALFCTCIVLLFLVPLDIVSPMILFSSIHCYTGGQSVSHVLLWQPSECVQLIVNCVSLFSENKYDDDDVNRFESIRPGELIQND